MVTDALEIRMARLEGASEQINERLGAVERELSAVRTEIKAELKAEIGAVRAEIRSESGSLRSDIADMRRQLQTQFYWTLTLILGAVLFPVLRDLALTR